MDENNAFAHLLGVTELPQNSFTHLAGPIEPDQEAFKTAPSTGGTDMAGINLEELSSPFWRAMGGISKQTLGAGQTLSNVGSFVSSLGGYYPNKVSEGFDKATSALDKEIAWNERVREAASETAGVKPGNIDWYELAGTIAAPTNYVGPGGPGGALAKGAVGGVKYALSEPVNVEKLNEGETYGEAKAKQLGVNALAGAVGGKAIEAAGNVIGPRVSKSVQTLLDAGVKPTIGQIAGSGKSVIGNAVRRFEEGATSVPVLGDMISARFKYARSTLNRGAWDEALAPIGEKLPKHVNTGEDALVWVKNRFDEEYSKIMSNAKGRVDAKLINDLDAIIRDPHANSLPVQEMDTLAKIVQFHVIERGRANGGTYLPKTLGEIKSYLSDVASRYTGSNDANERALGHILFKVSDAFKDMLKRYNPNIAKNLDATDEAYSKFIRPQIASSMQGTAGAAGEFTPAQLNAATRRADRSVRKMNYGRGKGPMVPLAKASAEVMNRTVPDSGTPARLSMIGALGGLGYYVDPSVLLAPAAASALYSPAGHWLARHAMVSRPETLKKIGDALRAAGIRSGVPAASYGSEKYGDDIRENTKNMRKAISSFLP